MKKDMSKYYYGKVCEKHPELEGLRNIARRMCTKCNSESVVASVRRKKSGVLAPVMSAWIPNKGSYIPHMEPVACLYVENGMWKVGITQLDRKTDLFVGPYAQYWQPLPTKIVKSELKYEREAN